MNTQIIEMLKENVKLKDELMNCLDEKEKLVLLCDEILQENEKLEKKYNNLKNSKLGRITIWYWKRRKQSVAKK